MQPCVLKELERSIDRSFHYAQTRNPHAVQRHLQKCFDAIHRLEFATASTEDGTEASDIVLTTDINAMLSPEGERVQLGKGLKARGNVEDWLGKVEASMFLSLKKRMQSAISDLHNRGREMFLFAHPSQVQIIKSCVRQYTSNAIFITFSDSSHGIANILGSKCSPNSRWKSKCWKGYAIFRAKVLLSKSK